MTCNPVCSPLRCGIPCITRRGYHSGATPHVDATRARPKNFTRLNRLERQRGQNHLREPTPTTTIRIAPPKAGRQSIGHARGDKDKVKKEAPLTCPLLWRPPDDMLRVGTSCQFFFPNLKRRRFGKKNVRGEGSGSPYQRPHTAAFGRREYAMSALLLAKPIGAGPWGHKGAKMIFQGDLEIPIQKADWTELQAQVNAQFAQLEEIEAQQREDAIQPRLWPRDENSPPGDERRTA